MELNLAVGFNATKASIGQNFGEDVKILTVHSS